MSKVKYEDRYAEVRQIAKANRAVCYWRNNLSIKDFIRVGEWYVLEDSGEYKGLRVWMRIMVREDSLERMFKRNRKGIIEFWGKPGHMGIMVRLRTRFFPGIHRGSEGWLIYEYGMDGSTEELSFVGTRKIAKRREEIIRDRLIKNKECEYNDKSYEKEAC